MVHRFVQQSRLRSGYKLKADLTKWLKGAQAYGNHDKVVELVGLEQFYKGLSDAMRFRIQYRNPPTVNEAAKLAEYASRRNIEANDCERFKKTPSTAPPYFSKRDGTHNTERRSVLPSIEFASTSHHGIGEERSLKHLFNEEY